MRGGRDVHHVHHSAWAEVWEGGISIKEDQVDQDCGMAITDMNDEPN